MNAMKHSTKYVLYILILDIILSIITSNKLVILFTSIESNIVAIK